MFKKISVFLPTRGRVASLGRLIQSMRATVTDWSEVELLFRCDDDDRETISFLRSQGFSPLVGPRYRGYASMPVFQNELLAKSTGDVIFLINDDGEFFSKDWPKLILEAANRYPDGIFNFGLECGSNSFIHPFPIMSRRYVEAIGHVANEELYWIDVYQNDIARAFDRVIPLKSVVFKHYWFEETDANPDATRQEARKQEIEIVFDVNARAPDKPPGEWVYEDVFWNWRPEYKRKHEHHVKLAIDRIKAAVKSGKFGPISNTIGDAVALALRSKNRQLDSILAIGQPDPTLGGIVDLGPQSIARIEAAHFPEHEFEKAGNRLICRGNFSDSAFLYRVARRVGKFGALVIWDTPSIGQCLRAYFFFRRKMALPGTIIFVSAEPGDSVESFVKNLTTGKYDQARHELHDLPIYRGHVRAWVELLEAVPWMPVNKSTILAIPELSHSEATNDLGAQLVKEGVVGYNIIKWLDCYFAVPQSCGPFDLDVAVKCWKLRRRMYVVGKTLNEVECTIAENSPSMLTPLLTKEKVDGFNIVEWLDRSYGVPFTAGAFRTDVAVECWKGQSSLYIVGDSSLEVERRIATNSNRPPVMVKEGIGGYNVVEWLDRFYGLPQTAGAFRTDLAIESWDGQASQYIVGDNLAEVEAKITAVAMK